MKNTDKPSGLLEAIEAGHMPAEPWKGRISKKVIGCVIRAGYWDTGPMTGVIVDLGGFHNEVRVFFPHDGTLDSIDKEQIFSIGKKLKIGRGSW